MDKIKVRGIWRKPRECQGCGRCNVLEPPLLCKGCRDKLELADKAINAVYEQGLRRWVVRSYIDFTHGPRWYELRERLDENLKRLLGLAHSFHGDYFEKAYNVNRHKKTGIFDASTEEGDAVDSPRVAGSHWVQGNTRMTGTAEQAKAVGDLLDTLQDSINQAYLDGKADGTALLRSLASGEITMQKLEKEVLKR